MLRQFRALEAQQQQEERAKRAEELFASAVKGDLEAGEGLLACTYSYPIQRSVSPRIAVNEALKSADGIIDIQHKGG